MIAARFAGQPWVSLFSDAATAKPLFDADADSRRMEVAWVGCRPEEAGWSLHFNRAGEPVVGFARAVEAGEPAFRRLCARFEIPPPVRQVRATERGFLVLGARGRPVKSAPRGFALFTGDRPPRGADRLAAADRGIDVRPIA
jgi:hypothetical protein